MNISQLINILERQIREGDVSDQEKEKQDDLSVRSSSFKAPEHKTSQKKSSTNKKDDEERPDSKMNPKQLKDKNAKINTDNTEFEEDDNPLDMFNSQITKNVIPKDTEDDDEENTSQPTHDKNTNISQKPFNLEFSNNYDKFVKIVNSFRASESIRNDKTVQQYWEKLTLAEKQAVYVFFDNLTKVSNAEKTPDFSMPRTPVQLGIKISAAGQTQQNQSQNNQKVKTPTQQAQTTKVATQPKTNIEVKPANNSKNPITPITVGESHKRYISIDALLKEVK